MLRGLSPIRPSLDARLPRQQLLTSLLCPLLMPATPPSVLPDRPMPTRWSRRGTSAAWRWCGRCQRRRQRGMRTLRRQPPWPGRPQCPQAGQRRLPMWSLAGTGHRAAAHQRKAPPVRQLAPAKAAARQGPRAWAKGRRRLIQPACNKQQLPDLWMRCWPWGCRAWRRVSVQGSRARARRPGACKAAGPFQLGRQPSETTNSPPCSCPAVLTQQGCSAPLRPLRR